MIPVSSDPLAVCSAKRPDLVLLDIEMPVERPRCDAWIPSACRVRQRGDHPGDRAMRLGVPHSQSKFIRNHQPLATDLRQRLEDGRRPLQAGDRAGALIARR